MQIAISYYKSNSKHSPQVFEVLEIQPQKRGCKAIGLVYHPKNQYPSFTDYHEDSITPPADEYGSEPLWLHINEEEAIKIVPNLKAQKALYEFHQTEANIAKMESLAKALDCIPRLNVYVYRGIMRVGTNNGAEYSIHQDQNGNFHGEQTGLPDI